MKYTDEMGSGAMIYVHTTFNKDSFRHSKADTGDTQTHRQQGNLISLLLFFQNKGSGLTSWEEYNLQRNAHSSYMHLAVSFFKNLGSLVYFFSRDINQLNTCNIYNTPIPTAPPPPRNRVCARAPLKLLNSLQWLPIVN
jgi:hypothetical protein